jgi:hypothetical protein
MFPELRELVTGDMIHINNRPFQGNLDGFKFPEGLYKIQIKNTPLCLTDVEIYKKQFEYIYNQIPSKTIIYIELENWLFSDNTQRPDVIRNSYCTIEYIKSLIDDALAGNDTKLPMVMQIDGLRVLDCKYSKTLVAIYRELVRLKMEKGMMNALVENKQYNKYYDESIKELKNTYNNNVI